MSWKGQLSPVVHAGRRRRKQRQWNMVVHVHRVHGRHQCKALMAWVDTGSRHIAYYHTWQQLLKLQFRFQFYFNFGFKIIYRWTINTTVRQTVPVTTLLPKTNFLKFNLLLLLNSFLLYPLLLPSSNLKIHFGIYRVLTIYNLKRFNQITS